MKPQKSLKNWTGLVPQLLLRSGTGLTLKILMKTPIKIVFFNSMEENFVLALTKSKLQYSFMTYSIY